jgi:hypothetical protein
MATNFYFQNGDTSGTTNEQRLVEDLVIESLKIYGHDIYYMPRTLVNRDTIFDEDTLSQFTQSYPLEMYLENVNGFDGEGDLFTKFGIEIRDQATFIVSQRRWEETTLTSGGTFTLTERPAEGDLLYFPKTGSIFEIKLVEFTNPFYQVGKLFVYRLQCELFQYSSEVLNTGTDADEIEDTNSLDMLQYQMLLEDGGLLKQEVGGGLVLEEYQAQKTNVNTDNTDFITQNEIESILDFSEINPFGELGGS